MSRPCRLSPEELRGLVNRCFSTMTLVIRDRRGTLDKCIGDAIMAFCGAPLEDPQHAARAVHAALSMNSAPARTQHRVARTRLARTRPGDRTEHRPGLRG